MVEFLCIDGKEADGDGGHPDVGVVVFGLGGVPVVDDHVLGGLEIVAVEVIGLQLPHAHFVVEDLPVARHAHLVEFLVDPHVVVVVGPGFLFLFGIDDVEAAVLKYDLFRPESQHLDDGVHLDVVQGVEVLAGKPVAGPSVIHLESFS